MKDTRFWLFGTLLFFVATGVSALVVDYTPASVGAGAPEVYIKRDSTISIKSAKVDQIVGTTFYLQVKWGQLPMRFVMKTDGKTQVVKKYGGSAVVAAIKLGDYLDTEGDLIVGSDFFGLNAKQVKDWTLQEESEMFSGTITEVNPASFLLQTPFKGVISVQSTTTTSIKKGAVVLPWGRLVKGDMVLFADGTYDYSKNVLTATQIIVYQQKLQFGAKNYEGILQQIEGTTVPTAMTVSVSGVSYRVILSEKSLVQKKNRSVAELTRFVVGDTIRFYGPIREEEKTLRDELVVDAEIVRNLNL